MNTSKKIIYGFTFLGLLVLIAYAAQPDINITFTNDVGKNSVVIDSEYEHYEPDYFIGSLVDMNNGQIIDNYLKDDAKISMGKLEKMVESSVLEKDKIKSIKLLSFLSSEVGDNQKAEMNVMLDRIWQVKRKDVKFNEIKNQYRKSNYGIIFGCSDYIITFSLYSMIKESDDISGFGMKLSNKWYDKQGSTKIRHHMVAMVMPVSLPEEKEQILINAEKKEELSNEHLEIQSFSEPTNLKMIYEQSAVEIFLNHEALFKKMPEVLKLDKKYLKSKIHKSNM